MKINSFGKLKINSTIFRAYDIRGIYPQEVNEDVAYFIGRAFVKFLKKKNPTVVIGRDNRLSSLPLFKKLSQGICDQGGNVIDIGLATTPLLYFSVAHFNFDAGINITGSHLSAERNGFKLVREKAIPISRDSGLKEIQKIVVEKSFILTKKNTDKKGKIFKKRFLAEYLKFNLKRFNLKKLKSFKVAVDTANAVSGILMPQIFKKINCRFYHIFPKLDGNFPNHDPDPLIKNNLKKLQKEVKNKRADLGIALDGDGDRVIFIDERGGVIGGDLITALISQSILKENPGEKILFDIRSSSIVPETITKAKGFPVRYKIGHSFFKEKMRKENILFAGELSGHYYHQDHYFCECPIFVLLKIMEIITESKKPFSELIKSFKKYFYSGEINFEVKNKREIFKKLEKKFKKSSISKIDGLRVDFKDWWFLVRPSNTEPLIRLVVEAKTERLMRQKIKELSLLIK